ncbi:MAG: hypothetical protein KDC69_10075 [Flavobacteriaceae bacterium]|nr:hypothetical protein [Flavobacteriaceae bacterium]
MARKTCPVCHGSGDVPGHLQPYHQVGHARGMGAVRCNGCGGSGVIDDGLGQQSEGGASGMPASVGNPIVWIFGGFFALVFANAPVFGLNWFVSGIIGFVVGNFVGNLLISTRIGRYILLALGLGFVMLVILELINR